MNTFYTLLGMCSCLLVGGIVALPSLLDVSNTYREAQKNRALTAFAANIMGLFFRGFICFIILLTVVFLSDKNGFIESWSFRFANSIIIAGFVSFLATAFAVILAKARIIQTVDEDVDLLDDTTFF